MSLLLKALKQAEAGDKPAASQPAAAGRRAPDLDLEPLAAPGSQAREWVEPPGLLFGSSGLSPAPVPRAPGFRLPRLSLVPATALIAVLIALAYGIYLYFELQPQAGLPVVAVQTPPAAAVHPTASLPAVSSPPPDERHDPVTAISPNQAQPVPEQPRFAGPSAPRRVASAPRVAPAPATRAPDAPRLQADPHATLLARAYAAYQSGNLNEAERYYAQAAASGRSVDALLGLATIASLKNRDADAQRLYRQVIDLEPRHPVAQAALLDMLGNTDAQAAESHLKILIERDPGPALYQTLGSLYANQQRWNEAQAAYFEAFRGAPDNADYAFNLAVSLDQLRQYPAARAYYEKALALGGAHRFDRTQAEARIRQLQNLR
ncbi:MAG: tetratricopeptide repeat protein [Thiobacillus sp.]